MVAVILTDNLPPFLFSATINASQKGKVSKMIEAKNVVRKNLDHFCKIMSNYQPV